MKDLPRFNPAPVQQIREPFLRHRRVSLRVLRLDLIHPRIAGNKWFKLKHNLAAAAEQGDTTLLSFGGAYSNHLYALAAAGKHFGFRTIGVVRGELREPLNSTLAFVRSQGMELHPVSRGDYRLRATAAFQERLRAELGHFYLIPEGGSNFAGLKGCREIVEQPKWESDSGPRFAALACGTGTTLAGLVSGGQDAFQVLGFPVLKGGEFLYGEIEALLRDDAAGRCRPWELETDYHFGGYARVNARLLAFCERFRESTGIPVEPVYTGKLFYGLYDLIQQGRFPPGSEILALHTGGLRPENL